MYEGVCKHVYVMNNIKMGEFNYSLPPQKKEEKKGKMGNIKTSGEVNNIINTSGNNNNNNNNNNMR